MLHIRQARRKVLRIKIRLSLAQNVLAVNVQGKKASPRMALAKGAVEPSQDFKI